jgi:hypothetical protein
MAINPNPAPILCADLSRHRPNPPPLATGLVGVPGRAAKTGRCEPCIRTLAAASSAAVLVDVYDLGAPRIGGFHDDHPAPDLDADRS